MLCTSELDEWTNQTVVIGVVMTITFQIVNLISPHEFYKRSALWKRRKAIEEGVAEKGKRITRIRSVQ